NPFERQAPYSGLMGGPLLALLLVIGSSPEGKLHGFGGPFHTRLAHELRTLTPPMHPGLLATALHHRGNTGIGLHLRGCAIALPRLPKRHQQAWSQSRACSWQRLEASTIGMLLRSLGNRLVEAPHRFQGGPQRRDERLHEQGLGQHNALVTCQCRGAFHGLKPLVDALLTVDVMLT